MNITRRNFVGAAAMGAVAAMGVAPAMAEEAAPVVGAGIDLPWCGAGSEKGDWVGTPEDIKALGGCTMPLDEINRRRKMYVDAQTDYTCADGTVIPAWVVKVRALSNTYSYGIGNELSDTCFNLIVADFTEEEALAYLDMPMGKPFTAYEFAAYSGRDLAECEAVCESLAGKAWLHSFVNDRGRQYCQIPFVQGYAEYHMPEIQRGTTNVANIGGCYGNPAEMVATSWYNSGSMFFSPVPVTPEVVQDGAIYPLDDLKAVWATKNKFSLSPCFCRYTASYRAAGGAPDLPNYPDGDFDLSDTKSLACDHDLMTCLSCGEEAQFWIDHKVGREITYEEAMARLEKSIEQGFVMQRTNSAQAETICSCHGDCCGVLGYWKAAGSTGRTYKNLSHYTLEVATDTCLKCGLCADRCPMAVITMDEETGYPVISGDPCVVCGQCAYVCPTQSRILVPKPEGTFLPQWDDCIEVNNMLAAERFENGLIW